MTAAQLADHAATLATTPADALRRIETALTDENDCSQFLVTFAGGSDPVTVTMTPDQVRAILSDRKDH